MKILYETERLVIREWDAKDAEDVFEYWSDPQVLKFLTFPIYTEVAAVHERLAYMKGFYSKPLEVSDEKIDYAIVLKKTNKVIGSIGYSKQSNKAGGIVDIGYMMHADYHGKGYMTEAVKGLFKYIKQNKIAMRIEAKHNLLNPASGAVMKRAGMTYEGFSRKSFDDNSGARVDLAHYSILAEEIE